MGSSHHRVMPLMRWIRVNKDLICKFHWLFELQAKSNHKWKNDGFESLSEGSAGQGFCPTDVGCNAWR